MALSFCQVIVTLRLQKHVRDPYFFYDLKRVFEQSLRRIINCTRSSCSGCNTYSCCCFPVMFSQALTSDPQAIRRFQKPSLPFVFHFPILSDFPNKGLDVEIGITLIGRASEFCQTFIMAFLSSIEEESLSLVKLESTDYSGNRYLLGARGEWHLDNLFLFTASELYKSSTFFPEEIKIDFLTPMRLIRHGAEVRELMFSTFIKSLFRRVSSFAFYCGGVEMDEDFKWLAERSKEIQVVASETTWSHWKCHTGARVSGLTGWAVFRGDLHLFQLFLLLGQFFNVGKGCAYGAGEYCLRGAGLGGVTTREGKACKSPTTG